MQVFLFVVLSLHLLWAKTSATEGSPVAETDLGTIVGKYHNVSLFGNTFTVRRFLGIPYAEPPIGDLRFKKPKPKLPFTEPYYATDFGNICYQMFVLPFVKRELPASEDCLLLNIFAPEERDELLPVMIYIHGGGYFSGASNPFVADALAAYGKVIVVTINYRVSLWGFLNTGDEIATGDYGFYDQHLAIKWVHDHISDFGGDPGSVTLFGESAGASCVILQSLFAGNAGLFQRVIAQSTSINHKVVPSSTARKDAENFGKAVGCKSMGSAPLVECLRKISGEVLFSAINDPANGFITPPWPFMLSINSESDFVYEEPIDWFKLDTNNLPQNRTEFFASLGLLMGINSAAGALRVSPSLSEPNKTYFEDHLVPTALQTILGPNVPEVAKLSVLQAYTDWNNPTDSRQRLHNLMRIYSDSGFGAPTLETTQYHASFASERTYYYLFDVMPSERLLPAPEWVNQANLGDELGYLFFGESDGLLANLPGHEGYIPEPWESDVAKHMITMWANFAKTG